ncbi:hypothetical protein L2719_08405 [Shewanella schlegeliana]|uniref:Lipoprotein n=1 Tax=Shewanella schlegeliana TaxID=190308 RepID=A0ABS1T1G6_9GAMM|nr:hypothetical protein [Shewanella schlegeliana]MBL4914625.1 hypothetical protein [Shewanella schlegeliana]MCL1109559.1 hypothetical protein [Shewanella schlegeliana]GIU29702.1 hypothetical protein TUM4433_19270 [Shewanella schlegeliana]
MLKKLKWVGLSATVILLSACGSTNEAAEGGAEAQTNTSAKNNGYRCEKITVTGSRMPVRKCTTQAQRDRDEREAQRLLSSGRVVSESGG